MGGQKGITFFNRYLARNFPFCCVTVKANQNSAGEGYPLHPVISDHPLRYAKPFSFFHLRGIIRDERSPISCSNIPLWLAGFTAEMVLA